MSFENKVVIVTGASSGIGAAFAMKFPQEGAKVVLVDQNEDKLRKVSKMCGILGSKLTIVADLTKEDDIRRIVNDTITHFGQLDVIIHCAGMGSTKIISDSNVMENFDLVMATNLRSIVYLTHLASKHLIESKGCLLNISSAVRPGLKVPEGSFAYSTSKAALDHCTRLFASELSPMGVRVNTISVGPVNTEFVDSSVIAGEEKSRYDESMESNTALNRVSQPNEIADLGMFLVSDKAVSITGANFVTDNGLLLRK